MIYISDSYNTKDWTNVVLEKPITQEQYDLLQHQQGGMFHVHRAGTAVKFEHKADADWFKSRIEQ